MKKCFLFLLLLCAVLPLAAQNGLDLSFGQQGFARFSAGFDDEGVRIAATPDGGLLTLSTTTTAQQDGDVVLTKTDTNGVLISSFGSGGVLRFDFDTLPVSRGVGLSVNADGSFVVLGTGTDASFARTYGCLVKFSANGQRDYNFAGNGLALITFLSTADVFHALRDDGTGRLLVCGMALSNGNVSQEYPALARFTANGFPDTSFGTTGKITFDFLNGVSAVRLAAPEQALHLNGGYFMDAQVLPGGSILCAGAYNNGFHYEGALVRFLDDGRPDSSFFTNGFVRLNLEAGSNQHVDALAVLPDSGFTAILNIESLSGSQDFTLLSCAAGSTQIDADPYDISGTCDRATGIVAGAHGDVWVCGNAELPAHCSPAYVSDSAFVMRFTRSAGAWSPDVNFARQGKAVVHYTGAGQERSAAAAMTLDASGIPVTAGFVLTPQDTSDFADLVLARFLPELLPDGVSETAGAAAFALYPNPVEQELVLHGGGTGTSLLRIFDITGRLLLAQHFTGGECRISMEAYPRGVYIAEVQQGNRRQRFRFAKA